MKNRAFRRAFRATRECLRSRAGRDTPSIRTAAFRRLPGRVGDKVQSPRDTGSSRSIDRRPRNARMTFRPRGTDISDDRGSPRREARNFEDLSIPAGTAVVHAVVLVEVDHRPEGSA